MKKSTSILAVAAVVGFSALTATPASAVVGAAFKNCTEAAAAGAINIPIGDPRYASHLDGNSDGVACERGGAGGSVNQGAIENQAPVQTQAPVAAQAPAQSQTRAQVAQKPVGGAPTGVEQETDNGMGFLALGGLVAAAATGTVIVRRRIATQA